VLPDLEQFLYDEFADLTTSLLSKLEQNLTMKAIPTYPHNRDFFDMVLEALGLFVGILSRHFVLEFENVVI
jgi:hypothetical protein